MCESLYTVAAAAERPKPLGGWRRFARLHTGPGSARESEVAMPAGRRRLLLAIILILPAIPGLRGFAIPPAKFQPTSSVFAYSALRRATEPRLWRFFPAEQSCSALVPRRAPKAALCGARGAQERSSASSPPSDGGGGLSSGSAQCKTHRMSRRRTVLARVVAGAGVLLFGSNAREAPAETGVGAREAALVNPAQVEPPTVAPKL